MTAVRRRRRRITLFSLAGEVLQTIPFEPVPLTLGQQGQFYFPYPVVLLADGSILGWGGWNGRDIAEGRVTTTPLLRMTRRALTVDTIGWVPIGNDHLILRSATSMLYRSQPFSDAPLTAYAANAARVFVVDRRAASQAASATLRVVALQADGDTAWSASLPYTPRVLDAGVSDSVLAHQQKSVAQMFPPTEVARALYLPKFWPPIRDLCAGVDGRLWLGWDDGSGRTRYTILGSDGRPVAEVSAEQELRVLWASEATVWAQVLDADDVPTLVRYRVVDAS